MNSLFVSAIFMLITVTHSQRPPMGLIVNGNPTTAAQYPFIADIRSSDESDLDSSFCTGSLYRKAQPAVILTAAHCFEADPVASETGVSLLRTDADQDRTAPNNDYLFFQACGVVLHEDYIDNNLFYNDVALIFLDTDLTENEDVECVTIADADCAENEAVQAIGYGSDMVPDGPATDTLEYIDMQCGSDTFCMDTISRNVDNFTCATSDGTATCTGDSGGPLVRTGTNIQFGVLSFGVDGCSTATPEFYLNVVPYKNWIDDNIAQWIADNPDKSGSPTSAPSSTPSLTPSSSPSTSPIVPATPSPSSSPAVMTTSSPSVTQTGSPSTTQTGSPSSSPVAQTGAPTEAPIPALVVSTGAPSSSPVATGSMFSVMGTLTTSTPFSDLSGLSSAALTQWAMEVVMAAINNVPGVTVMIRSVSQGPDGNAVIEYTLLANESTNLVLAILGIQQNIADETVITTTAGITTTITGNEVEDVDLISESSESAESVSSVSAASSESAGGSSS